MRSTTFHFRQRNFYLCMQGGLHALLLSARNGHITVVRQLAEAGALINLQDKVGK